MREIVAKPEDAGQRLDRFIGKLFPRLPSALLMKSFRKKRIKLNGKRAEQGDRVGAGDIISVFIKSEFLDEPVKGDEYKLIERPNLCICFEDTNVLVVNKPAGQPCQPDIHETVGTLINHIKAYLSSVGAWDPVSSGTFAPALCNRIDRNTSGLVIAAKTAVGLREINAAIRRREIEKRYLCIVHGVPEQSGTLECYLAKNAKENRVYISDKTDKAAVYAALKYTVLESSSGYSLVRCELITGRTHQIRAQMAGIGHPLLGDGKYGKLSNPKYKRQALLSYGLTFSISTGPLKYLSGVSVETDAEVIRKIWGELTNSSPRQII